MGMSAVSGSSIEIVPAVPKIAQSELSDSAQSVHLRKHLIPRQGWTGSDEHIEITFLYA